MASFQSWVPVRVELHPLQPAAQPAALLAGNLVQALVVFYVQLRQCQRNQLGGKPQAEGVVEDARAVLVEVDKQSAVQLFGTEAGLEVETGGEGLVGLQWTGGDTAGAEHDGA